MGHAQQRRPRLAQHPRSPAWRGLPRAGAYYPGHSPLHCLAQSHKQQQFAMAAAETIIVGNPHEVSPDSRLPAVGLQGRCTHAQYARWTRQRDVAVKTNSGIVRSLGDRRA